MTQDPTTAALEFTVTFAELSAARSANVQVTSAEEVLTLQLSWLDVAVAGVSPLASWSLSTC